MMKRFYRPLVSVILLILFAVNAVAQIELGPHRFVTLPAPQLSNPTRLKMGLPLPRFVGRVGGIAFDGEAQPNNGFTFTGLALNYRPGLPDGQRLGVKFGQREATAPIYDWQLIPIAKFADSEFFSCVTLFGRLSDSEQEKQVRQDGGKIINYHPEFVNTLVGLRLFQLDRLIFDEYCTDLPKRNGAYILGRNESAPDLAANQDGFVYFKDYLENLMAEANESYSSYIINDSGSDIRFGVSGTSLKITGEPRYYFWRHNLLASEDVDEKIGREFREAELSPSFNARAWLTPKVLDKMKEYEKNYDVEGTLNRRSDFYDEGFLDHFKALHALAGDQARTMYLQQQTVDSLKIMWIDLSEIIEEEKPIPMDKVSQPVSAHPELLRRINPAVWDSGVNVMRYAAFFRYCKQHAPEQWRAFLTTIRRVTNLSPSVTTPTVIYPQE